VAPLYPRLWATGRLPGRVLGLARDEHLPRQTGGRSPLDLDQRLGAGEQVARMYQEPGLAWLERQAEAAEQLLAERQDGDH
jgi:hypothetical protein